MKNSVLFLLLISLITWSCEKQNKDSQIIPNALEDILETSENTLDNSTDTFEIIELNVELKAEYTHDPKHLTLDLNNDQIDDIKFASEIRGSEQIALLPYSFIEPLHNQFQILGNIVNDTTYININD